MTPEEKEQLEMAQETIERLRAHVQHIESKIADYRVFLSYAYPELRKLKAGVGTRTQHDETMLAIGQDAYQAIVIHPVDNHD